MLHIDFGGGLKTQEDIETAFNSGAKQITLGSIAVQNPEFCYEMIQKYGEKIILGADCDNRKIKTSGWLEEKWTMISLISSFSTRKKEYRPLFVLILQKDGMLEGPSTGLYIEILYKTSVQLVASGGISGIADVYKMKDVGCSGNNHWKKSNL